MLDQALSDSANAALDGGNDAIREAHCAVLEMAVVNSPLEKTLAALIEIVESTSKTGVLGSILILDEDGRHLRCAAAPSLPTAYSAAIDGAEIGPCAGSCGTAAYSGKPVFVSDIATDPLWAEYKAIALPHGLHACCSRPGLGRPRHADRRTGDRPCKGPYGTSGNRGDRGTLRSRCDLLTPATRTNSRHYSSSSS